MAEERSKVPFIYPREEISKNANIKTMDEYRAMYKESIENPEAFWGRMAERFHWERKWDKVEPEWNFDMRKGPVSCKWFIGGKTNICYNCIDKHVKEGKGDRVAFIYEGNDPATDAVKKITYSEVLSEVQRMANVLKSLGVEKGDRVAIYLPMVCELPMYMLACARIGAIHSVVFGGFAVDALASRLVDSQAKVLITADGVMRGPKRIDLKAVADASIAASAEQGHKVKHCVVVERLGAEKCPIKWHEGLDLWHHDLLAKAESDCPCEWVDAEDELFMLYTSGSTGKPKGVVHTTGGYMLGAWATVHYIFDYQEKDVYWCTADCGWITGHTYITYGPMLNCATQIIFEGVPTFPDAGRFWEVVDKHQVSIFYTAPTAVRALMAKGNDYVTKYKRTSLRVLGSVGEPINPEAWKWYFEVVGNKQCSIVDTWWQTETGSNMITSLPGATPMKPGCATYPFFGVEPVVVDVKTSEIIEGPGQGYLCIKSPWPSMMRTVYNDHPRFEATYFSQCKGLYFTGDGCFRDDDGCIWITGRVDDVINVSGHRIGTAELESVFVSHPKISEAAVVGYPHPVKGEGIYVYAVPMADTEGSDALAKELVMMVRGTIGAFAAPDHVHWAPTGVPKTRSGKIMRRILRKIAAGEEDQLGDISTLADPSVVEVLLKNRPNLSGK